MAQAQNGVLWGSETTMLRERRRARKSNCAKTGKDLWVPCP